MATLHTLAKEMLLLEQELEALQDAEEAPTAEQLATELSQRLGKVELDFEHKVKNLVRWIINLESDCDQIEAERARLKRVKEAKENQAKSLRNWLKFALTELGETKFDAEIAKISISKPRESLEVDDEMAWQWPDAIFKAACTTRITVNKATLKQLFPSEMKTLPGVRVVKGEPVLTIR